MHSLRLFCTICLSKESHWRSMTTIGPSRWFTTNRELAQFLEREVGVKIVGRPSTVNFHRFITIAQFDTRICFWIAEESQTIMSYSKISLQCWMEIKFYSIGNGLHPLSCASQVKLRKALERRRHFRIVRNEKWEWWGGGLAGRGKWVGIPCGRLVIVSCFLCYPTTWNASH